jgi:hypothetical protein
MSGAQQRHISMTLWRPLLELLQQEFIPREPLNLEYISWDQQLLKQKVGRVCTVGNVGRRGRTGKVGKGWNSW